MEISEIRQDGIFATMNWSAPVKNNKKKLGCLLHSAAHSSTLSHRLSTTTVNLPSHPHNAILFALRSYRAGTGRRLQWCQHSDGQRRWLRLGKSAPTVQHAHGRRP